MLLGFMYFDFKAMPDVMLMYHLMYAEDDGCTFCGNVTICHPALTSHSRRQGSIHFSPNFQRAMSQTLETFSQYDT
jgi:hypothetical protein